METKDRHAHVVDAGLTLLLVVVFELGMWAFMGTPDYVFGVVMATVIAVVGFAVISSVRALFRK